MENSENQKPLTLEVLVKYNQDVLFPYMEETFVTKADFQDFKNETSVNMDSILKKLDMLIDEKEARNYQDIKNKKLWAIMIKALREHQILSVKEIEEIAKLEIF